MNAPPPIALRIEKLVLDGFSPGDRHRITEGLEDELHGCWRIIPLRRLHWRRYTKFPAWTESPFKWRQIPKPKR